MLENYFKVALRNLLRNKLYALINILGLSAGIAIALLIFLFVRHELNYDRYLPNWQRIYRIVTHAELGENTAYRRALTPPVLADSLQKRSPEVEYVTKLLKGSQKLVTCNEKRLSTTRFFYTDSNFFNVFGFPLLKGTPESAFADTFSVVISESIAKKYFKGENPIGKKIALDNGWKFTVSGVAKDAPANSHFHFDFLASIENVKWSSKSDDRQFAFLQEIYSTYALLKPNANRQAFADTLQSISDFTNQYRTERLQNRVVEGWQESRYNFTLQKLSGIHTQADVRENYEPSSDKTYLYIFASIALIILIIACINFMNLTTAKSALRAQEVGMRKVAGASRKQLIVQFLSESVFLSLLAFFVALAILELLIHPFNVLTNKALSISTLFHWQIIPFLLLGVLVVGIVSGSYPALYLSSFNVLDILKGRRREGKRSARLRSALVISQFVISIALIVITIFIFQQIKYVQNKNLGFDKDHIFVVERAYALQEKKEEFRRQLLENPNIQNACYTMNIPGKDVSPFPINVAIDSVYFFKPITFIYCDEFFVETFGLEIAQGRNFTADSSDYYKVMLNQTALQHLRESGWQNDTLKFFNFYMGKDVLSEVVGVVKDFHFQSLHEPVKPLVLEKHSNREHLMFLALRIKGNDIHQTIDFVENLWGNYSEDEPFDHFFMNHEIEAFYRHEKQTAAIFSVFSVLAVLIAALGLFGLSAFTAEQRTKEIGIRKAMGASPFQVAFLLTKKFTRLILLANLFAFPLAYLLVSLWLENFAYHTLLRFYVFLLVALGSLLIAWIAVSFQTLKAARKNPAEALTYE